MSRVQGLRRRKGIDILVSRIYKNGSQVEVRPTNLDQGQVEGFTSVGMYE